MFSKIVLIYCCIRQILNDFEPKLAGNSDLGQSKNFTAHVELMTHNIPAFENVADMTALPPTGSMIVALPMKIQGGSLRIIALVPEN